MLFNFYRIFFLERQDFAIQPGWPQACQLGASLTPIWTWETLNPYLPASASQVQVGATMSDFICISLIKFLFSLLLFCMYGKLACMCVYESCVCLVPESTRGEG